MMLEELCQELSLMQERMHRKSKKNFREYLKKQAEICGLEYQIPQSRFVQNVVIGSLKNAKVILGAHYDTPPRMPSFFMKSVLFLNVLLFLATAGLLYLTFSFLPYSLFTIPVLVLLFAYPLGIMAIANKYNYNDNTSGVMTLLYLMRQLKGKQIAFIFFDNEEKGLIGSLQFVVSMRNSRNLYSKRVIILDCVGCGDTFGIMSYNASSFSNKIKGTVQPDDEELNQKYKITREIIDKYHFEIRKPSTFEMSDHFSFKNYKHAGIMCYNRAGRKYAISNIHSHKDRTLDLMNIRVLAAALEKYIMQGE